jgi:hypothetical protein
MKALTTTEQALSFIQSNIAEAHANGKDLMTLLMNPEVVFSLQVLEADDKNMALTLVNVKVNKQEVQVFTMVAANANGSLGQTPISLL